MDYIDSVIYKREEFPLLSQIQEAIGGDPDWIIIEEACRDHQAYRGQGRLSSINIYQIIEGCASRVFCSEDSWQGPEPDGEGGNLPSSQYKKEEGKYPAEMQGNVLHITRLTPDGMNDGFSFLLNGENFIEEEDEDICSPFSGLIRDNEENFREILSLVHILEEGK